MVIGILNMIDNIIFYIDLDHQMLYIIQKVIY